MNEIIQELTRRIGEFRDARDLGQFHGPKEMAVAIAAEAGELLQHFVWQDAAQREGDSGCAMVGAAGSFPR